MNLEIDDLAFLSPFSLLSLSFLSPFSLLSLSESPGSGTQGLSLPDLGLMGLTLPDLGPTGRDSRTWDSWV